MPGSAHSLFGREHSSMPSKIRREPMSRQPSYATADRGIPFRHSEVALVGGRHGNRIRIDHDRRGQPYRQLCRCCPRTRGSRGDPHLRHAGPAPGRNAAEDFSEEAAQAWRNVEDALARAGTKLSDIISVRQWLTDAADIPVYAAVRSSVIKHKPVFMLAVIPALVWPDIRVEVEVIAIRPPA
jgi:2-iminobutanoate/2-iminopropanoate deaminase